MQSPQAASGDDLQEGMLKIAVIIGWQARLPEDARAWRLRGKVAFRNQQPILEKLLRSL